ncbi:hypothetical protein GCM10010109_34840 [Actinoplanes campanulatus]|nr:hypothetical protein GCM10010109_34840 [Actinoplanes campanulatus]GID35666.1 hypothetical protein Aca09nite_21720 [Actinoplanes campanulatus]
MATLTVGGAASREALVAGADEPDDRTPVEAGAGRALSATVAATKTARADPAVTVLSLMRGLLGSRPIHGRP